MASSDIFFSATLILLFLVYCKIYKHFIVRETKSIGKLIVAIGTTGGLFVALGIAFDGLAGMDKAEYSIGYPIGVALLMWLFGHASLSINQYYHFEAEHDKDTFPPTTTYRKIAKYDSYKIPIYPRITIHDMDLIQDIHNPQRIIFDLSDFVVINESLGSFTGDGVTFLPGNQINLKGKSLRVEKVQVDILNFYDDYSGFLRHTHSHKGSDTPYNIQISIFARWIDSQH